MVTINPDKDFVKEMTEALKANEGYCPCSMVKNDDTKCICKEFRDMNHGTCRCGLYSK